MEQNPIIISKVLIVFASQGVESSGVCVKQQQALGYYYGKIVQLFQLLIVEVAIYW